MRPKKHETTGSGDLFRARLDQIINMRHELVQLAGKIDWELDMDACPDGPPYDHPFVSGENAAADLVADLLLK
jgi:IS5 family transposase